MPKRGSAKDIVPIKATTKKIGIITINASMINIQAAVEIQKMYPDFEVLSVNGDVRTAISFRENK